MALKRNKPIAPPANLSLPQMEEAIRKIDRRIEDLKKFDPSCITDRGDGKISALEHKLSTLIKSIFHPGTDEYNQYEHIVSKIDTAGYNMNGTPIQKVREGLHRGVSRSIEVLTSIKDGFVEELEDAGHGSSASRAIRAYQGLELHPEIERHVERLFADSHYSNAIETAVKSLNALVRLRSGIDNADGVALMERAFSPKNPILKFNDLADQSDKDEQKGFMMLFCGAVSGLRNPRAHRLMEDDPERALEFIAFISLLAKLLDEADQQFAERA